MGWLSQRLLDISSNNKRFVRYFFASGIVILLVLLLISIKIGAYNVSISTIFSSILSFDGSKEHLIIKNVRMPRTIVTMLVGANLAVAGALMQAILRNPLASPGVFGINAGAAVVVVFCSIIFINVSGSTLVLASFLGGVLAAALVYFISHSVKGGKVEVKMALTGVVIQILLSSVTKMLIIFSDGKTESVLFWLAGSVAGAEWSDVRILLPWSISALAISCYIGRYVSVLSLGEEIAQGLGQRVALLRGVVALLIIILAGVSVAIVGPIGFVGLIVPHIVRYLVGVDYRVVIPVTAISGSIMLVIADIISRFVQFPFETPVGVVMALIGAPYFIYLARSRRR